MKYNKIQTQYQYQCEINEQYFTIHQDGIQIPIPNTNTIINPSTSTLQYHAIKIQYDTIQIHYKYKLKYTIENNTIHYSTLQYTHKHKYKHKKNTNTNTNAIQTQYNTKQTQIQIPMQNKNKTIQY